jgi:succinate-acetate transporter protein
MGIFFMAVSYLHEPAGIYAFGLTAFTSYGSFWLTLVAILIMPKMGLADARGQRTSWAYTWAQWGVFTLFMFFGTRRATARAAVRVPGPDVLFALRLIGHLADNEGIVHIGLDWSGVWRSTSSAWKQWVKC